MFHALWVESTRGTARLGVLTERAVKQRRLKCFTLCRRKQLELKQLQSFEMLIYY